MFRFFFITLFFFIFIPVIYGDNFYRWSESGKVWFSNYCPRGKKCTLVMRGIKEAKNLSKTLKNKKIEDLKKIYESIIKESSLIYKIPENLIKAVIKVESNFYKMAVSPKGAKGLMQLMPKTAERMGVENVFDPRDNIFGGVKYLRILANLFGGDIIKTLAGYHAGEKLVEKVDGIPSRRTADYVRMVLREYKKLKTKNEKAKY